MLRANSRYVYEGLDGVCSRSLMALFLLTIDLWPKILVTSDFCDVEF